MNGDISLPRKRAYALLALVIFLVSRFLYSAPLLFLLTPILLVSLIERRGLQTMGFAFDSKRVRQYLLYAIGGFLCQLPILAGVVLLFRHGLGLPYELSTPPNQWVEFLEQLYLVGLPEETFYRGYLQTRLGAWLGEQNGYLISALIFGLAHVIARTQEHGSEYSAPALVVGAGAFCGALVFGCMLIRTKSLYPSILAHIATNMFASGLVKLALG